MFFCQNCNNSLDIKKNTNIKKVDKTIINTPEEFIKIIDNDTQNYYLNFNESNLSFYLKKENYKDNEINTFINKFYQILEKQKELSQFYLKCINCNTINILQAGTVLYSINFVSTNSSDFTNEDVIIKCNDPILPRTNDYICPNNKCITHKKLDNKEAIFFRNDKNFNLTYICCVCYNQWHI
jgi:hypothetical protein